MKHTLLSSILLCAVAQALPASATAAPSLLLSIGASFCFGDGTGGVCPCSNPGVPGAGCDNSAATGGAILSASNTANLCGGIDDLVLTATGVRPSATSTFIQGDVQIAPIPWGQGLRCLKGSLFQPMVRFGTQNAFAGTATYPRPGDCPINLAVQSTANGGCHPGLGDLTIGCGKTRYYQLFYRDPIVLGGCAGAVTFNASNAVEITW